MFGVKLACLAALVLAASAGQDRRVAAQRKKLERALESLDARDAGRAAAKLAEYGGREAARIVAESLGRILDWTDSSRRAQYTDFDSTYDVLYGIRVPQHADRSTVLDGIRDEMDLREKRIATMEEMRGMLAARLGEFAAEDARAVLSERLTASPFWGERAAAAGLLAKLGASGEPLLAALAAEPEPTVEVALLQALASIAPIPDAASAAAIGRLGSSYWSVRLAAIRLLRRIGRVEPLDALIEAIGSSQGRVRAALREAIDELTRGLAPGTDDALAGWWKERREGILRGEFERPPEAPNPPTQVLDFFTIPLISRRVAFVVDVSKSMKLSARWNPQVLLGSGSSRSKPDGGRKLAIAEFQLLRAFDSLPDGTRFALVLYSEVTRTFELQPRTLDGAVRRRIGEHLREVEADGETDLFHAIDQAMLYTCKRDGRIRDDGLDTIYILSDGSPTAGLVRSPGEIRLELRRRNRYAGVAVHTIYVGRPGLEDAAALMRDLAADNEGRFAAATR